MKKRILSIFIAASMLLQSGGAIVFAENDENVSEDNKNQVELESVEEENEDGSVFNFSAAKYVMSETDESYEVTVERQGNAESAADVIFKAVDVMAVYGEDYTVLDEDGSPLEKTEGTVIAPEQLKAFADSGEENGEYSGEDRTAQNDVFEARNAFLGIGREEQKTEEEEVKDEVSEAVKTVNSEIFDAEGASGVLHFDENETEKTITVVPVNNDKGEADRIVLMALLGSSDGSVAPNATTTLTIMDDEEYVPPVFEMGESRITLDASSPVAELTVRRVSGEDYYSSVTASTYSMTAKADEDFTAIGDEQIVFAPGETEKTVTVEALNFDKSGDFGVRIISDGSCEIGENERTIVHIEGEKSVSEEPKTKKVSAKTMDEAALAANTVQSEPGVLGSKEWILKDTNELSPKDGGVEIITGGRYKYSTHIGTSSTGLGKKNNFYNGGFYQISNMYGVFGSIYYVASSSLKIKVNVSDLGYRSDTDVLFYNDYYKSSYETEYLRDEKNNPYKVNLKKGDQELTIKNTFWADKMLPFTLDMASGNYMTRRISIDEMKLVYDKPVTLNLVKDDGVDIKTRPLIDLNESSDQKYEQKVDYSVELPKLLNENGEEVTKMYPSYEILRIVPDSEEWMKQGVVCEISGLTNTINDDFLYGERRIMSWKVKNPSNMKLIRRYANVNVHLESADGGDTFINIANKDKYGKAFAAETGTLLQGTGSPAAGKVITGYKISAGKADANGKITERKELYTYKNPNDSSLLGGASKEEWFCIPAVQEEGWTEIFITPMTEIQNLTIKPHPSTKDEKIYETVYDDDGNIIGEKELEQPYNGRVYLNRTFSNGDEIDKDLMADENGLVLFEKLNSGSVFTLNSITPNGYMTEWINGTMDEDGDGVIDNEYAANISQSTVDNLYIPVYGNKFVYQANQASPLYYYRFKKFEPSQLLNGKTRVGYVKKDKRTILDYNGKEASYSDLTPCANAVVQIGENKAVTDSTGRFEIPMNGVPDAVRVSASVSTDSGNFVTHVQSNVENNILIPFYDTFEPQGVSAVYEKSSAIAARGIAVEDKPLTVTVKVKHSQNSLYIKNAAFYIMDSNGNKVIDCNLKAEDEESNYKVSYTNNGEIGYATLKMNPKEDMLSGYQIYVGFTDQNGTDHRMLNTGYRFIQPLNLGTVAFGAIGAPDVEDIAMDIMGSAMFNMDLGQIDGFTTTTGLLEPDVQVLDGSGNKTYQYDATLYSYRHKFGSLVNWSGDKDKDDDKGDGGDSGDTGGDSGDDADASEFNAQHGEVIDKMKKVSTFDLDKEEAESQPKGANVGNSKGGIKKSTEFNFDITPAVSFDLVTTARVVGKDDKGNDIYKHFFEEMSLGLGLEFDVNSRIEISFPIGISVMIKPTLNGEVKAIYYMKTDYGDDKYWNKRPIEYSSESFGLFKDFGDNMYRAGYIELNPALTVDVGVKVAIAEVDLGFTADFDMDFKFDSNGETRTYGSVKFDMHVKVLILKLTVYSKKFVEEKWHLFGEDDPIDSDITLMSAAVNEALEDGDTEVKPMDRSYLDDRRGWTGDAQSKPFLARLFGANDAIDEDHPKDKLLQQGVMPGDDMASAMISDDKMFAAYIDDAPDRSDNDRGCLYYTVTKDDGSWSEPIAIEDDGTLDREPVIYDMDDKLLIAWLTASDTFDIEENTLGTVSAQLNSLNIHAVFFDKETGTLGDVFEVTKETEDDHTAEGDIAVTRLGDGGARIYYTKTQYLENPENANELIAASSVIAYRDFDGEKWSEEYTEEERQNLVDGGIDPDDYTEQWYGQRFADTRINGSWPVVTDLEVDSNDAWEYFAFIADEDGSYETSNDRKVYLNFDAYDAPVCVTPETGAYDDLQFIYSGSELMLMFKTDRIKRSEAEEEKNMGGVAYINLSEVFEKQGYTAVLKDGTYQMVVTESVGSDEEYVYEPETAVEMDGMVQQYTVFADKGGRMYIMWTDNTIDDDGKSSIQLYAASHNSNISWIEGMESIEGESAVGWSAPVMMTSPMNGDYNAFTAQNIAGGGIAFIAKRTNTDGESEMVFHLREPYAVFVFNEDLFSTRYVYEGETVNIDANVTNVGLKAEKSKDDLQSGQNTWVAMSNTYVVKTERMLDGEAVETINEQEMEMIWLPGETLHTDCEWTPEEIPDNTDIRISVIDKESDKLICSETVPVIKTADIDLGQLDVANTAKNEAVLSFELINKGNIPADLTAVISVVTNDGEKELDRIEAGEFAPLKSELKQIYLTIDEEYQTIEDGNGAFKLKIDILDGDKNVYSTQTSGSIFYSPEAMAAAEKINSLTVETDNIKLKKGETSLLKADIAPAEALQGNKIIYVSSDESVVRVNKDGNLTAVGQGRATVTAYAVPSIEFVSVLSDGSTVLKDSREFIPDSMIKMEEINVRVTGSSGGGGGGGSSSKTPSPSATPKPTDKPQQTPDVQPEKKNPFTDVKESDWYYSDVLEVYKNGLMVGTSDTLFEPNISLTRGMLPVVLGRLENVNPNNTNASFGDIDTNAYYAPYVAWAYEKGFVNGFEDGTYRADEPITREQMAKVIHLYNEYKGKNAEEADINYSDKNLIGEWAIEGVKYCYAEGIMNGRDDGTFDPKANITRAEFAATVNRLN